VKRLFLDANVLFTAAHNPNGKAAFLISLGRAGLFQLVTKPVRSRRSAPESGTEISRLSEFVRNHPAEHPSRQSNIRTPLPCRAS
jgi:hypothetical protein